MADMRNWAMVNQHVTRAMLLINPALEHLDLSDLTLRDHNTTFELLLAPMGFPGAWAILPLDGKMCEPMAVSEVTR
jgi:hypothetical protein